MSIRDRGKSEHSQRRGEYESCSWQGFPGIIVHRPKTSNSPSDFSKGTSTAHNDRFTSTPSIGQGKKAIERLYDRTTLAPASPPSRGYGSNEESVHWPRIALTLYEECREYLLSLPSIPERSREETARFEYTQKGRAQMWRVAFLISNRLLAAEYGTPFEKTVKCMNDLEGIGHHIRRNKETVKSMNDLEGTGHHVRHNKDTSHLMGMLRELGVTQDMISPIAECLENRPLIRSMFPEDQEYVSSKSVPFPVFRDYDPFQSVPFPVFWEYERCVSVLPTLEKLFYEDQEYDLLVPSSVEELKSRITIAPRLRVPRVPRNFKYWRHAQLPRTQKEISPFSNVNGSKISIEGEPNVVDLPIIRHRRIAEWKIRAGKRKDWSLCPIRDLPNQDKLRGRESYKRRYVPCGTANSLARKMLQVSVFTAACLYETPRDMLRRYSHNAAKSDSSVLLHLRPGIKRKLKCKYNKKKPHYLDLERKAKRDRAMDVKEIISEGIFQRVAPRSDSEVVDTAIETDGYSTNCPPSDSVLPTKVPAKSVIFAEFDTCAADALSIPYESRIGAIVGCRFVLQGLMSMRLCYDVHVATDVYTDIVYTAKAYSIRGTKGNERKYRVTSLKRNASKASCIASVDQSGRKWLFFSGDVEHVVQTGILNDVSAWYEEEQYQHHFPVLSLRGATCTTVHTTPRKTYAACVQEVSSESKDCITRKEANCIHEVASQLDDRTTRRKERVRDRQRNKRKQKRAAEAVARKATDDKSALPEPTDAAVDRSRPASISHVDPELETLSKDGADVERFLALGDEDMKGRKERIRDRRRNKRKQKRIAEAVARKATDDKSALPEPTDAAVDRSRPASISHLDPELEIVFSDEANLQVFLVFLEEDMRDRLYPGLDEEFWKYLTEGPPETIKHRCLEVFAGYRVLAHIGTQLGEVNPRMRPSLKLLDDYYDSLLLQPLGSDKIIRRLVTSLLLRHVQTRRQI